MYISRRRCFISAHAALTVRSSHHILHRYPSAEQPAGGINSKVKSDIADIELQGIGAHRSELGAQRLSATQVEEGNAGSSRRRPSAPDGLLQQCKRQIEIGNGSRLGAEHAGHQAGTPHFVDRYAVFLEDHSGPLDDLGLAGSAVHSFAGSHLDQGKRSIGCDHRGVALRRFLGVTESEGTLQLGGLSAELLDRHRVPAAEQDESAAVG